MKKLLLLTCFAAALLTAAQAQTADPCTPRSFLKQVGDLKKAWTVIRCISASADGNLFVPVDMSPSSGAGIGKSVLAKMTPSGEVLWSRRLFTQDIYADSLPAVITHLLLDSEGLLIAAGYFWKRNTLGQWEEQDFVCRYDPEQDSLHWVKHFPSAESTYNRSQVVEKQPGGNYMFCRIIDLYPEGVQTEWIELQRQTGAIVSGRARLMGADSSIALTSVVAHQGALYAAGQRYKFGGKEEHLLCRLDLTGTQLAWAHVGPGVPQYLRSYGLLVDDDTLVSAYLGRDDDHGPSQYMYVQKTALSGEVAWVRRYEVIGFSDVSGRSILKTATGYLIWGAQPKSNTCFLLSLDKEGHLQRYCRVLLPPVFEDVQKHNILDNVEGLVLDSSFYQVATIGGGSFSSSSNVVGGMVLKSDLVLSDINACPFSPLPNDIEETTLPNPTVTAVSWPLLPSGTKAVNLPLFVQSATPVPEEIFCAQCDAPCGPPLSLGPDREFSSDTTVLLQAGSGYAAYLWQDGSTAPTLSAQPGSTVYWVEVRDVCGFVQRDTLRLTLNEAVCDHKDLSCIRWELLDVEPVAANSDELRYRVKLTNSCASALHYVCFQVPAGLTATYPLATYTAQPDGRDYAVRSPNYSPFYSLRFSAAGGSPLSSGSFDLFEYHLPAQAQPAYIGTTVRLEDGSTYSALLNTFRCPPSTAYDRSDAQSRRYLAGQPSLHLWPNPAEQSLWLHTAGWAAGTRLTVYSTLGMAVVEQVLPSEGQTELPVGQLQPGTYICVAQDAAGHTDRQRLVISR